MINSINLIARINWKGAFFLRSSKSHVDDQSGVPFELITRPGTLVYWTVSGEWSSCRCRISSRKQGREAHILGEVLHFKVVSFLQKRDHPSQTISAIYFLMRLLLQGRDCIKTQVRILPKHFLITVRWYFAIFANIFGTVLIFGSPPPIIWVPRSWRVWKQIWVRGT